MKWAQDKTKHLVASASIVILTWLITNDLVNAVLFTVLIGILKEAYDEFFSGAGSSGDIEDIFANMIGIFAGALICCLI